MTYHLKCLRKDLWQRKNKKTLELCNKNALDGTLISEGGNECAVVVSKNLK